MLLLAWSEHLRPCNIAILWEETFTSSHVVSDRGVIHLHQLVATRTSNKSKWTRVSGASKEQNKELLWCRSNGESPSDCQGLVMLNSTLMDWWAVAVMRSRCADPSRPALDAESQTRRQCVSHFHSLSYDSARLIHHWLFINNFATVKKLWRSSEPKCPEVFREHLDHSQQLCCFPPPYTVRLHGRTLRFENGGQRGSAKNLHCTVWPTGGLQKVS